MINSLIEFFDDQAVEAVVFVCEKFLIGENSPSSTLQSDFESINIMTYMYESNHPDHGNRKKEVALFLLGSISEDIIKFRIWKGTDKLSKSILQVILDESSSQILVGRALWCVT